MAAKPAQALAADYIVIGAGSAGAVIASRLTEDPNVRVILVEAGGEARSLLVQLPVGFARMVANERFDWRHPQEADPTIGGRSFVWSAGKMLGGGSSINGQVYIRGTRGDFDRWARDGAPGWSFDEVLPYFKKSEHWHGRPSQAHGMLGPLSVSPMRDVHPLVDNFVRACGEAGIPLLDEYNAGDAEGVYLTVTTQRGGWRCSTEKAFLRPARKRPNLEVLTHAEVEHIRIEQGRAVGVTLIRDGVTQDVDARREVILCAGALGSPALLMRSGIGDPALLAEHGIPVRLGNASVGRNLQEHCSFSVSKFVNRPTLNSEVGPLDMARHALRYAFGKKGPFGAPAVQVMGLWRSDEHQQEPDLQFSFSPLSYDIDAETTSAATALMPRDPAVSIYTSLARPKSRGRIKLTADRRPLVSHRFFEDEEDLRTLVRGSRLIRRLYDTRAMDEIVTGNRRPDPMLETEDEWADFIRQKASPNYHPSGSCRMGSDDAAVVDPTLRLRGLDGLRVADASIMPTVPSGNTNAPSIMIGEKAADLIRAR